MTKLFRTNFSPITKGKGKSNIHPRRDHEGPEGSIAVLFL